MREYLLRFLKLFPDELTTLLVLVGGLLGGWLLKVGLFAGLAVYERRAGSLLARSVRQHLGAVLTVFLPVLVLSVLLPLATLPPQLDEVLRRVLEIALIVSFAGVLIRLVAVLEDLVLDHYHLGGQADLEVRKLFTQLQFVKKMVISIIFFVAAALVLMSFATVRRIGTGLLTSAGIASVIVGFAAQRSLGNLLAGFQIAFTQPLRIDDALVVEGEFGRVEEITFTNVVLRLWDERRLVLPLTYFIEKPFQNWTRTSSQLTGIVFLYLDYSIPVEAVREELRRILAASILWDQRICTLQVTDVKERTLELRALVSAANSSDTFSLRCEVREKLVAFVQQQYPGSLPKVRLEEGRGA